MRRKSPRKLLLQKQTLRDLELLELQIVGGGGPVFTKPVVTCLQPCIPPTRD